MSTSVSTSKIANTLSWVIISIIMLLPFHAFFTTWLGANFGHIDLFRIWKELLLAPLAFVALWLAYQNKQTKKWLSSSPLVLLIVLYALLHLSLGFYALAKEQVSASALIYALIINLRFLIFLLVCLIVAAKTPQLIKFWQKYILWPAVLVIIFALLQHFVLPANFLSHFGYGPKTIPAYQSVDLKPQYVRVQSTLRGANPLGAYLVLIITALAAILIRRKNKLYLSIAVIATLVALFLTYSRSAWLGSLLSLALIIYWSLKSHKLRQWTIIIAGVVMLIFAGAIMALRNNNLLENTLFHTDSTSRSPESSNAVRTEAMLDGAKSVLHSPQGSGPGTAGPASFRNSKPPRIAENYFIQIGQEVGFAGLILFLAINYLIAMQLWLTRSNLLSKILLASLAGLTIVNLLSHAWTDDTLAYLWWGLAGIALAQPVIMNKERIKQNV